MKKILFLIVFIFISIACTSSDDASEKASVLRGDFIEVSPEPNRIFLNFNDNNQLVKIVEDMGLAETYTFTLLKDNQLSLSCNACDEEASKIVLYQIIDENSFKMGGIFPANPSEIVVYHRN